MEATLNLQALLILQPMLAVGLLTVLMAVWMYFTRIPAMSRLKIHPQKGQDTSKLKDLLPDEVNRVSNNYNHLFEQPTLFYVVCLTIAFLGWVDQIYILTAWTYAILRIAHSLVQATVDRVMIRFLLFVVSWIVLGFMTIRLSLGIFGF